jgi:hypothetical protein
MESASVHGAGGSTGAVGGNRSEEDRNWARSNTALRRWITARSEVFADAVLAAASVRRQLEKIFPILDDLASATCPWCPEPCCIANRVWFDFRDILFFHLSRIPIPPGPVKGVEKEPCRYLAAHGCILPRLQRPWACTQYLCGTQRRRLGKTSGQAALSALENDICTIAAARMDMEASVQKTVGH